MTYILENSIFNRNQWKEQEQDIMACKAQSWTQVMAYMSLPVSFQWEEPIRWLNGTIGKARKTILQVPGKKGKKQQDQAV